MWRHYGLDEAVRSEAMKTHSECTTFEDVDLLSFFYLEAFVDDRLKGLIATGPQSFLVCCSSHQNRSDSLSR
jgi:hypothetical protein